MPSGRDDVVIVGGATSGVALMMVMLRVLVLLPAEFVAPIVKLDVPSVVGVPEITPVLEFKLKPAGREPLAVLQMIGVVPLAASVWL